MTTDADARAQAPASPGGERPADRATADTHDYRYLFEHSPVPQSITRPAGEIEVNDAFLELLGYSREEMRALQTWQAITHPDDVALSDGFLDMLRAGERDSVRFEKRYLAKDGSIVWAELNIRMRRDDEGDPVYFMTTAVDITERKRVQAELELSESRFATAFRASPDAVNITRLSDGLYSGSQRGLHARIRILGRGRQRQDVHRHRDVGGPGRSQSVRRGTERV